MKNEKQVKHHAIKSGYCLPEIPHGYDKRVAMLYPDGEWVLDFVNNVRCDFASEHQDINLEWPFKAGFIPFADDWETIGFMPLS